LAIPDGAPVILFLGRLTEQKGVNEIVVAFNALCLSRPDSILVLVGPQEKAYGASLEKMIEELPCRQNIRLLGPVYDDGKYEILSTASLFVTLSKNEGLPVAVLEALALRVPPVVTSAANLPEIAEYGAGEILADEHPDAVAASLRSLLEDTQRLHAMGERAKTLVRDRFSPEVVVPQLLTLYQSLA